MDENHINRIEDKLDKIIDKQSEHSSHLAVHTLLHEKNTADLEHHIKRTDLLQKQMDTALLPIKAAKLLVGVASGISIIYGLISLIKGI